MNCVALNERYCLRFDDVAVVVWARGHHVVERCAPGRSGDAQLPLEKQRDEPVCR